ncbi:hypothetical protein BH11PLA2_BH11PLA2_36200 [soil metagenome]
MADFEVAAPSRQCAVSGRELKPGERITSVLTDENGTFVRRDYAVEAWPGPPEQAVAYWSGVVPDSGKPRKPVYNDDLLLDLFRHLAESDDPQRVNFRYVVALLLMRRKRLKFEDVKRTDGPDVLILRDAKAGTRHEVQDPRLSDDAVAAVQDEVFSALGWTDG